MEISSVIARAALGQPNDLQTRRRSQASDGAKRWLFLLFVAAVILTTIPPALSFTPIKIIPHKAVYVFEMESADPGGGVEDIGGGMTFEWADACDGWALKQHYFLRISTIEGTDVDISISNVTWEAKNGIRYRFIHRRGRNGTLIEDIQGVAELSVRGGSGSVMFEKPKEQNLKLPSGTMFPTDFMLSQMQAAARNERMDRRLVFEGSAVEGPQTVSTTILPLRKVDEADLLEPAFGTRTVWPMYVAYFPPDNFDGQPDTELSIYVQPNGVVMGYVVDYGDFKLRAKLVKIEALPDLGC
tara:strand:+ start:363 stop:1259 length:897 start_codon:yes stop_codon:yes gene_type:complete